jgi:hypothetical protein
VLSAGPATHFRRRPEFNLNAAGFVPMRRVALTLRRVAQMVSFENGMKVALKIMPPRGFIPTHLGPPRRSTLCFLGERRKVDLSARERTDVAGVGFLMRLPALPHAAMALPLDCHLQRAGAEVNILSKSLRHRRGCAQR